MIEGAAAWFDDFDGVTFLNCASMGPLPKVTSLAMREAIALKTHPNRIPDHILFSLPDRVRRAVAPSLGVEPEQVFLGNGAGHAVNQAAWGFPWQTGDEVIVPANDFPSNIYIWGHAARRFGGKQVLAEGARYAAGTNDILAAVTDRTRAIMVSLVDFGSGEVQDVEALARLARDRDIFLGIDATQAAGVTPLDLAGMGVSMVTVAGYKWMLGPYGCGFGWISPEWAERIPPTFLSWTAAHGVEDYNRLPRGEWQFVDSARRYDGPEAASFVNMTGLERSAEFLMEHGIDRVHAHIQDLLDRLEGSLPTGFRRRSARGGVPGPILLVEHDEPERIHTAYARMRERGIWVALREDGLRVSPHMYNTVEDIDRFVRLLTEDAA